MKHHRYRTSIRWTGNDGLGTASYKAYRRDHEIKGQGKPTILGGADPAFRGDPACWNPEELLVASLSACHQLWYLHLCASAKVVVVAYEDDAEGLMEEEPDGAGRFVEIVLRPRVAIGESSDLDKAVELHAAASRMCFVERTLTCCVRHEPTTRRETNDPT